MSKIKLGARPESFKPFPVKFTMPDGSEGAILATFKYRTRSEYGAYMNEVTKDSTVAPSPDGKFDFEALYQGGSQRSAQNLLDALIAWDLDEPLSLENVLALANEVPAACSALSAAYTMACAEGRLGN